MLKQRLNGLPCTTIGQCDGKPPGFVLFGCVFDGHWQGQHVRASDTEEPPIDGSDESPADAEITSQHPPNNILIFSSIDMDWLET